MRPEMQPGRLVKATAGRDKDKYFAVVSVVDETYVYIADGVTRRLANPKLKKVKHLIPMPQLLESIAKKLSEGSKVFDAELRNAIIKSAEESKEE